MFRCPRNPHLVGSIDEHLAERRGRSSWPPNAGGTSSIPRSGAPGRYEHPVRWLTRRLGRPDPPAWAGAARAPEPDEPGDARGYDHVRAGPPHRGCGPGYRRHLPGYGQCPLPCRGPGDGRAARGALHAPHPHERRDHHFSEAGYTRQGAPRPGCLGGRRSCRSWASSRPTCRSPSRITSGSSPPTSSTDTGSRSIPISPRTSWRRW